MAELVQNRWALLGGTYIIIGMFVVFWLTERLRRRSTPRHERFEQRFRPLGSDFVSQAAAAFPPLFLLLIAIWPLWALYIWASNANDDEPT